MMALICGVIVGIIIATIVILIVGVFALMIYSNAKGSIDKPIIYLYPTNN